MISKHLSLNPCHSIPKNSFKRILVTGGAGFIGSEFVRQIVSKGYKPVVVDKLTYAGDLKRLESVKNKFKFYKVDICNKKKIEEIFKEEKPQILVNFAAESHVDKSIKDSTGFIETNVKGTQILLDASRKYKVKRFIHLSTDEVYGEVKKGQFNERSSLQANSPYAASKAAADLFIKSYIRTYKFPAIIVRPCNNYGSWQYPEKLIPLSILMLLKGKKIPVYGKGQNIREWLHVSDCAQAIFLVVKKGKLGQIYNIGSSNEEKNINTVKMILKSTGNAVSRMEFVKDRPGHDFRYSLAFNKIKKELGFQPKVTFKKGLGETVKWYLENKIWLFSKWNEVK